MHSNKNIKQKDNTTILIKACTWQAWPLNVHIHLPSQTDEISLIWDDKSVYH